MEDLLTLAIIAGNAVKESEIGREAPSPATYAGSSSIVPGVNVIVTIGNATDKAIELEKNAFHQANSSIDALVNKGADRHVWNIDVNVTGLPEHTGKLGKLQDYIYMGLNFGQKPAYKMPWESAADYFTSIFQDGTIPNDKQISRSGQTPNYYESDNRIVVRVGKLYLLFDAEREKPTSGKELWTFFQPIYKRSGSALITAETTVRTQEVKLRYQNFTTVEESVRNLNRISLFPGSAFSRIRTEEYKTKIN